MSVASLHLGLTGGIGSGKSTVSAILSTLGAAVIDADAISRSTTAPGGSAIETLRVAFGDHVLTPEGALNREQMRKIAYSDPQAKTRLEGIIHPLVGRAIAQQTQQAQTAGARCIVFDIPLLVESGHWREKLDRILVIDCSQETQIARVAARNAIPHEDIRKILSSQATRLQRLACADMVLFNDGINLDQLTHRVHELSPQFGL